MQEDFILLRSQRKSLSIEIKPDLQVIVRAPNHLPQAQIEAFVLSRASWLQHNLALMAQRQQRYPEPRPEEIIAYRKEAKVYIPTRVAHFAQQMGLQPAAVTITSAKARFGSCSGNNRLSFSWRLMSYPPNAIDYVVVHELSHIVHKNHSPCFYALIETILPQWKQDREALKR